ncbi:MAG: glycerophosphodiester phosphodiesterase, partial [Gemmatimonadota bacterium]
MAGGEPGECLGVPFHDFARGPLIAPLPAGYQRQIHGRVGFAMRYTHVLTILDAGRGRVLRRGSGLTGTGRLTSVPLPTRPPYRMIQIIAHRGASRERLQNTLPAFQRAIDLGADAVELDVHVTADGTVVVHHDPLIHGTSTKPALAGRPIAEMTTAEVASFQLSDGSAIPTLAEVAALLANRLTLYCELKGAGTARAAIDVLRRSAVSSA